MTITIDPSLLVSYYNSKAGILDSSTSDSSDGSTGTTSTPAVQYAPTAPWASGSTAASESALTQQVLTGQNFINPNAAKIDLPGASSDYSKLFTLYQGLNALDGLATAAGGTNVDAATLAQYEKTFQTGLSQVTTYANSLQMQNMKITTGATMLDDLSTVGAPSASNTTYTTPTVYTGAQTDPVPAFAGNVSFNITTTRLGQTQNIPIDLANMGSQPRSMDSVANYINSQLAAAGVTSRFGISDTPSAPRTLTVGSQTVTLPAVGDAIAFTINEDSAETLTFSDLASQPASTGVYVSTLGGGASVTTPVGGTEPSGVVNSTPISVTTTDPTASTLVKVDPNGATPSDTRVATTALGTNVGQVYSSQVGSDGSVYMLADVSGTVNGQPINGTSDVALLKYDSAGNLQYTRTLGATGTVSGMSLAVSADGQVAIGGSVTGSIGGATDGPLDSDSGSGNSDSFVTLYDSSGNEEWTTQNGSLQNDAATAVAFGANDVVYVAGTTSSSMPGASEIGGQDGYLTAYAAGSTGIPKALFMQQFGTTGTDTPEGITVNGNTVYVASNENGNAVVRSFDTATTVSATTKTQSGSNLAVTTTSTTNGVQTASATTNYPAGLGGDSTSTTSYVATVTATADATRNLGSLQGGQLAGIAVDNGTLYVAGDTENGALNVANTTRAYDAGMDGFAASMSTDLTSQASDNIAYYGGAGNNTVTTMGVANGQVWIGGAAGTDLPGQTIIGQQGYIAGIDVATGQVSGAQVFTGKDGIATVTSLAVDPTGVSGLDALGLPKGTLNLTQSQNVVANTSLRPGDSFKVAAPPGSTPTTITVSSTDTFKTLAAKVQSALGYQGTATLSSSASGTILKIAPSNNNYEVQILPGPSASNALPLLGLTPGVARNTTVNSSGQTVSTAAGGPVYGLSLDQSTLTLGTANQISAAQSVIQQAMSKVQAAYTALAAANEPASVKAAAAAASAATSGTVPTYLTNEIANLQAGLSRLTGGS